MANDRLPDPERPTLWVVDDSPLEAELVRRALSPRFDVTVLSDGDAVLERVGAGTAPDLILLDWLLPGISGIEVCRFLRANPSTQLIPVIMLTVHGTKEDIVEGLSSGADDYLVKPVDQGELVARATALVRAKRYRERAERAEEALRVLLEHLPDAVLTLSAEGRIVYVNAQAERILRAQRRMLVGRAVGDLFPSIAPQLARVAQRDEDAGPLPDVTLPTGTFAPVARPLPPVAGARATLVFRDVTAERVASTQLRESEARFRFLAETIPQIVFTAEPDGVLDYHNQRWLEYTGLSAEQARDEGWRAVLHPDDADEAIARWASAVAHGNAYETESRFRRASDGEYRWHLGRALALRDAAGRVLKWFGTLTDITERKQNERAMAFLARATEALSSSLEAHASLQRLADLLVPELADWCTLALYEGASPALHVVARAHTDPSKRAPLERATSRAASQQELPLAFARALQLGRPELVADARSDEGLATICLDEPQATALRELGTASAMVVPFRLQGRVEGVMVLAAGPSRRAYDATDLAFADEVARRVAVAVDNAKLYELAQRERKRVEEANRAKDEFLAMVSHELRTPLNAILGWTRMLRGGHLTDEKRERALEIVERNARAQTQLIEDLLDISRAITGKLRLDVSAVDLVTVVHAALDSVGPAANAKGVRLQSVLEPTAGPVTGDPNRLQQVVWNLLTNAIKFTPRGGRVWVQLQRVGSSVEIVVADTGQGIPQEFLPHVFERFRQADGSMTRAHGGLGLGLAICRHIMELHGGVIEAQSAGLGQGATFTVRLPLPPLTSERVAGPAAVLAGLATAAEIECPPEIAGLRVLVVDDEADARELLVSMLERCRAEVVTAASAPEALSQLREWRPDVLISDIGMPGEDGYSLIRKVRALPANAGGRTPAVALTAYARSEDRTRALIAGFQMHVPKPIEPTELLIVIANVAGRIARGE